MGLLVGGSTADSTPGAEQVLAAARAQGEARVIVEVRVESEVGHAIDLMRAAGVDDAEALGTLPLFRMRASAGQLEALLASGVVRRLELDGLAAPSNGPPA